MIDTLRKQRPAFSEVTRGIAANDRVTVDFVGKIDGEEFEGGSGDGVPIVVGANQVMKEFEDALLGAKAGETREFNATFSAEHTNKKLSGKTATFNGEDREGGRAGARRASTKSSPRVSASPTAMSTVCAPKCAPTWSASSQTAVDQKVRAQVLEQLYTKNPLELPRQMVEEQIQELQVEMLRRAGREGRQTDFRRASPSNSRPAAAWRSACS